MKTPLLNILESQSSVRITNTHYLYRLLKLLKYCIKYPADGGVKHHILPKCKSWFPEYAKDQNNLILVTPRMHFIIHYLLHKSFPKDPAMYTACWNMSHLNKDTNLSSKQYESLRLHFSQRMRSHNPAKRPGAMDRCRGENNPAKRQEVKDKISKAHKGKIISEEQRIKQSLKMKGRNTGNDNPAKRQEVKDKISKALTGKTKSDTHRAKMSIAAKNSIKQCIHCGIIATSGNIGRWHNDRCKFKKES